ncbi:MAG: hypothetical protein KC543_07975, partial [Myxococcales bacterium]|nr:hypothetical protein [Myxococcales bacterium]
AAAGGALAHLGDPRGADALRRVLRAWRSDGRGYAVATVGALRLTSLADEVARLADRPRGVDPDTLRVALSQLAPLSAAARTALERLAPGSPSSAPDPRSTLP